MAEHTVRTISFFDPVKIAISGQAFRFKILDDSHVEVVAFGRYLQIASLGNDSYAFSCSEKEFKKIWEPYFHLDFDYQAAVDSIDEDDEYLRAAADFSRGIRILRQDSWETLISFIISQRRSIPSIMTSVERLCEFTGIEAKMPKSLGKPFVKPSKEVFYSFPCRNEMSSMSLEDIAGLGVGYRADYIRSAVDFDPDLKAWEEYSNEELYDALLSLRGVGKKVADCVMLFAFARFARFPVDVWMQRIQDKYYGGSFDISGYPDTAGIMQQFMFFYERMNKI